MSILETRLKETFDAVTMPPGLKEETLEKLFSPSSSMNTVETRLKETFNAVTMPPSLKEETLEKLSSSVSFTRKRTSASFVRKLSVALAACLILCVVGFGGYNLYVTETATIVIELNPSIELGINRFDTVVSVRAANEDGQHVLDAVLKTASLTGKKYEKAFSLIVDSDAFLSYINDESFIEVSIICFDERQSNNLFDQSEARISALPYKGLCKQVSGQDYQSAADHGMGVGLFTAVQVLLSLDHSLTIEDCESMSMREVRQRIAALDPENEYAWSSGANQGGGNQGGGGDGQGRGGLGGGSA